jgi:phosphatidylglycerophosphate synthase
MLYPVMFDIWLRALKDRLLGPLVARANPSVHPNVISIIALFVGMAVAWLAYSHHYRAALAAWLLNRALDACDGTLARVQGKQTDFGGYLDILLDFIVYAIIPIGLIAGRPTPSVALGGALLEASFFVNAASWMYLAAILERRSTGALAKGEGTTVTMPPGLIAGAETVVFYALFLIFPSHLAPLFATMGALVVVTVVQRLVWAATKL